MKSENQISVRCKQPIKIENPIKCLLPFVSRSVGEGNILHTVLLPFFFQFYFLNALPSDDDDDDDDYNNNNNNKSNNNNTKSNKVYVLGHKCILGSSQISF